MPRPGLLQQLRQTAAQQARLAEDRDRLIVAALDSGHTGSEIAQATGLTKSRVHQIARAKRS